MSTDWCNRGFVADSQKYKNRCLFAGTLLLRLALIYVPIMSRRVAGQMKFYADDLKKFDQRVQDAKHEGNGMLGASRLLGSELV